jgi:hypothetical protein
MNLSQRRNSFPARGDEKRQKNAERHDYSTPCGLAGEMALSQRSAGSVHKSRITRLGKFFTGTRRAQHKSWRIFHWKD